MALSANASFVQILEDTPTRTRALLHYHVNTAAQEVDVLKINVATLSGRTMTLTTSNVAPIAGKPFVLGELVRQSSNSAIGSVLSWTPATNAANGTLIVAIDSGVFATGNVVTGDVYGANATIVATAVPEYLMNITGVSWTIAAPAGAKVELEWANATVYTTALTISGSSGYLGRNDMPINIPNRSAAVRTGHLYVSTHGFVANSGYSIIVDLRKVSGFASRGVY